MHGRFVRVAEEDRPKVELYVDGRVCHALEGDTVLVAVLSQFQHLRESEFGDGDRAGFCLMGACQDCWVWTPSGDRLRACSTQVGSGLSILTRPPGEDIWPNPT